MLSSWARLATSPEQGQLTGEPQDMQVPASFKVAELRGPLALAPIVGRQNALRTPSATLAPSCGFFTLLTSDCFAHLASGGPGGRYREVPNHLHRDQPEHGTCTSLRLWWAAFGPCSPVLGPRKDPSTYLLLNWNVECGRGHSIPPGGVPSPTPPFLDLTQPFTGDTRLNLTHGPVLTPGISEPPASFTSMATHFKPSVLLPEAGIPR